MQSPHVPVLLDEVLQSFSTIKEGYFVDCTLGYAGHSSAMLERYGHVSHIGIDRDQEALDFSQERLAPFQERSRLYKGTFATRYPLLTEEPVCGVLADFGVSSLQLDKLERGFSFASETLDMRMDREATLSAYEVVNHYSQERLATLFDTYGEMKQAKRMALALVEARSKEPIGSVKMLSELALKVLGKRGKIHPATLLLQAIRIEVNSELKEIEGLLDALEEKHYEGMLVSLITFHSLEDRLVKNRFKKWSKSCICDAHVIRCECGNNHALGKLIGRKPVVASATEVKVNPRSRSAKLRTFQFGKVSYGKHR
jgi:16S rRNA (cytosine1402-N4)-methyltransferase